MSSPEVAKIQDLKGGGGLVAVTGRRPMPKPGKSMYITEQHIRDAVFETFRGRQQTKPVLDFKAGLGMNIRQIHAAVCDGSYREMLCYYQKEVENKNGKVRAIDAPLLKALIIEHVWLVVLRPIYDRVNPGVARNCLPEHGITAKRREFSVLKEAKRLFYDLRHLHWLVDVDQRQCYQRVTVKAYRRGMKYMRAKVMTLKDVPPLWREYGFWHWLIDFGEAVSFVDGHLPIGTPTSPYVHQIVMLSFDYWLCENYDWRIRYADNVFIALPTKEEAHQALWRVRQFWWYEQGIRAKRQTARIVAIDDKGVDICGYRLYRFPGKKATDHNKGLTLIRRSTLQRARKAENDRSWASYFGLMQHADTYRIMQQIENDMKLSQLTAKIRIDREMDAKNIPMQNVPSLQTLTLYKYEIRQSKGEDNWIKCLIGTPEVNKETGEPTGKTLAYEFHGNYQGIIRWIRELEKLFPGKEFLPIEDARIVNECGYIFEGSTNQLRYIEEGEI
ncbi:MAG: hypothetical protein IJQ44_08350 [Bacteroidaceae bacterium]|nr:hypothetical protein [Bacteroidaceae bacterium]